MHQAGTLGAHPLGCREVGTFSNEECFSLKSTKWTRAVCFGTFITCCLVQATCSSYSQCRRVRSVYISYLFLFDNQTPTTTMERQRGVIPEQVLDFCWSQKGSQYSCVGGNLHSAELLGSEPLCSLLNVVDVLRLVLHFWAYLTTITLFNYALYEYKPQLHVECM